jgi:hypothetical protein
MRRRPAARLPECKGLGGHGRLAVFFSNRIIPVYREGGENFGCFRELPTWAKQQAETESLVYHGVPLSLRVLAGAGK